MQQKTERFQKRSQLGLEINVGKTKGDEINTRSSEPISLKSGTVEEVQDFIYLGSNISTKCGAKEDVKLSINKAYQNPTPSVVLFPTNHKNQDPHFQNQR